MKRIISLCCVALILVMGVAVPVRADDTFYPGWIDLLEFSSANDSGSNLVYFDASSGSEVIRFSYPSGIDLAYVDILFRTDASSPTLSVYASDLTVVYLGKDANYKLYRAYGNTRSYNTLVDLTVNYKSGTWIDFLRFNVSSVDPVGHDIEAYCQIVSAEFEDTIHYVPDDEINHRIFQSTSDFSQTFFYNYIYSNDWKKYDYIDFQLTYNCFSITSVSAVMGNVNVPLEYSYLNDTSIDGNSYFLTVRLDVSQLDKTSDDYPMLVVMGRLDTNTLNSIGFTNCSGVIVGNSDSYLGFHFKNLRKWLSSQTSSLVSSISSLSSNLNTWIQTQTTAIQTQFTQLKTALSTHFTNLTTAIQTQFTQLKTALSTHFTNLTTAIQTQFTQLKTALNTHFSNLSSWISQQTATLEAAIRGDTAPGNSFQDDVSDKDEQLDDMAEVMDSVTKPAIKDINVSVNQYVKPADMQLLATPLSVFFEADLFRSMIIMSILLATVSFTLYGKR